MVLTLNRDLGGLNIIK